MDDVTILRLRAKWFENEDYQKGGLPSDFIRTLAEELRMAAYKIETLAAENARLRQEKAKLMEALETLRNTCRGLPSKRKTWGDLVDACQKARAILDKMEA